MILKVAILSATLAVLLAVIYSTSASAVDEYVMSCSYTKDKKTSFCSDNDPTNNDVWRCDKQKNGTWKCGKTAASTATAVPPDLKNAISKAQSEFNTSVTSADNNTKTPRDFGTLKDKLLLNDGNMDSNTSTANKITTSEANSPTPPPCPDKGPIPPDCTMKPLLK